VDVDNLKVGDDGKVQYSTGLDLVDKDGKPVFSEKPTDRQAINTLGGGRLPFWSIVNIGTDTTPGEYTAKIAVTDLTTKKPAETAIKFEVVKPRFGIIHVAFAADKPAQGPPPAPPVTVPGQNLQIFCTVVGFESKAGKEKEPLQISLAVELTILDDGGAPTLKAPYTGEFTKVAEDYKTFLPFQFPLFLNKPGKYKVKFKATDKMATPNKSVEQVLDLTVVDVK
jgi:hypothetical protein